MKPINRHFISLLLLTLMISAMLQVVMADDLVCIRCVDTTDLDYDAVTSNRILDGSVRTADLGIDAVTSPRIKNGEVRTADLAANAVTSSKILNGTIRAYDLADGAVTEAKLDAALLARVNQLEAIVNAQAAILEYFSIELLFDPSTGNFYPTVRVTGANLQVVNGLDATNTINGTGNLIVGYNQVIGAFGCSDGQYSDETSCTAGGAIWSDTHRSGSHNIVTGERNNYSQYGGLIAGYYNTVNRDYASVTGGYLNVASGSYSSVSGGNYNTANGFRSSVSGGVGNTASGSYSSVSGGYENTASASYSSVSGGSENTASASYSSVSGGSANTAYGMYSSVSGGQSRSAPDSYDWAAGALFQDY